MIKRAFDFFGSLLAILLLWPMFVTIAVLIKITDTGPVFFRQERVGRGAKLFRIWKFRSMRMGAEKTGPSITRSGDARVTTIGRHLRRTKLDELPQLFNVLVGEMSFVGPRPEVPKYVALYKAGERKILELRPGITDLASIEFRNEEELLAGVENPERFYREYCIPKKAELNLAYAADAGLLKDIALICRTVLLLVFPRRSLAGRATTPTPPRRPETSP